MMRCCILALCVALGSATARLSAGEFALRDGDTIVFLGDSITAARTYSKLIETFTLLRFPERKLKFLNRGLGGDTAHGSLARLDRDVFAQKATVLVVMFGVNDIGWGLKADEEHRQQYLAAIGQIVDRCRERGIRVYVCSAPVTAEDPDKSESGFLKKMCDEGMALSRSKGECAIDVQGAMREIQRRVAAINEKLATPSDKKVTLHAADGVHLSDLGQLAVAYALLKGWNVSEEVSHAILDAAPARVMEASGCTISDLARSDEALTFTRIDERLPFNYGLFYALNFAYVPVAQELNQYRLTVKNLPPGRWKLTVDGRAVGTFAGESLARGISLSSATANGWEPGGPWDAQATLVKSLVEARHEVETASFLAQLYLHKHATTQALVPQTGDAEREIVKLQRTAAAPRPYRFELRRADADK